MFNLALAPLDNPLDCFDFWSVLILFLLQRFWWIFFKVILSSVGVHVFPWYELSDASGKHVSSHSRNVTKYWETYFSNEDPYILISEAAYHNHNPFKPQWYKHPNHWTWLCHSICLGEFWGPIHKKLYSFTTLKSTVKKSDSLIMKSNRNENLFRLHKNFMNEWRLFNPNEHHYRAPNQPTSPRRAPTSGKIKRICNR